LLNDNGIPSEDDAEDSTTALSLLNDNGIPSEDDADLIEDTYDPDEDLQIVHQENFSILVPLHQVSRPPWMKHGLKA